MPHFPVPAAPEQRAEPTTDDARLHYREQQAQGNHVQPDMALPCAASADRNSRPDHGNGEHTGTNRDPQAEVDRSAPAAPPDTDPLAPSESAPDDIVARLRAMANPSSEPIWDWRDLVNEAAATIERLQAHILTMRQVRQEQDAVIDRADAENAQLRETVERQAGVIAAADAMRAYVDNFEPGVRAYDTARATLEAKP